MAFPVCGPKLSICCTLLSIWGVIMLAMLGIFFRVRSPALASDLPIDYTEWAAKNHSYAYIKGLYNQNSTNCFIASGIYVGIFAISFIMWRINKRADYTTS